jgi:hypothetical protein
MLIVVGLREAFGGGPWRKMFKTLIKQKHTFSTNPLVDKTVLTA